MHTLQDMKLIIESLEDNKHVEIFRILQKHKVNFSENKNGVFINLSELPERIIQELVSYINYVKKQENYLSIHENKKKQFKQALQLE